MHKTRNDIQKESLLLMILIFDNIKEDILIGKTDTLSKSGNKSIVIDGLLYNIFGQRRFNIPLLMPSPSWTEEKLLSFLDEVIEIVNYELDINVHMD